MVRRSARINVDSGDDQIPIGGIKPQIPANGHGRGRGRGRGVATNPPPVTYLGVGSGVDMDGETISNGTSQAGFITLIQGLIGMQAQQAEHMQARFQALLDKVLPSRERVGSIRDFKTLKPREFHGTESALDAHVGIYQCRNFKHRYEDFTYISLSAESIGNLDGNWNLELYSDSALEETIPEQEVDPADIEYFQELAEQQ